MKNDNYICCFGEVLWDDFPSGRLPGGAPMNVAIGLQQLGVPSAMISRVGNDALGKEIREFLLSKNCSDQWIQTDAAQGTGIVKVHAQPNGENRYEIVQPIAWDFIEYTQEAAELVRKAQMLVYGTLACRLPNNLDTLLRLADKAPIKVYDVNFRPPFYNRDLVEQLLAVADFVKMNDDELEVLAGWYGLDTNNEAEQMQYLYNRFQLQKLIVTKGAKGAVCLDDSGIHTAAGYTVQVQDTVGSGDAFLAGFLTQVLKDTDSEEALRYACAVGAFVASRKGANPKIGAVEIAAVMAG